MFAASTLDQRRPTGSAAAWLLVIVLLPYVGIPLYLIFGSRKVRRRARVKADLISRDETLEHTITAFAGPGEQDAHTPEPAGGDDDDVDWLTDGVAAYDAVLVEIGQARRGDVKAWRPTLMPAR